jgi:hypothetical protein
MTQYRVLTGIDYPPDKRAELGTIVSDIPEKSAKWLLDQGLIELADGKSKNTKVEKIEEVAIKEDKVKEGFKPNARDGDNDGFVQDGTEFQRPIEEK